MFFDVHGPAGILAFQRAIFAFLDEDSPSGKVHVAPQEPVDLAPPKPCSECQNHDKEGIGIRFHQFLPRLPHEGTRINPGRVAH